MDKVTLKDLLEAGSHFGHQARRWNPSMKRYIYAERDGVHIFDLVKTKDGLEKACEFVKGLAGEGKTILFLGTKRQAADQIRSAGERTGMPYVNIRWMGGLLTNFDQVGKSIRKLATLKDQREKGELKKYTKREQLLIDREIGRLEKFFGGVASLTRLPDALFVVDTHREEVAVREANRMGVPVVGMVDTNGDPTLVEYVIPINDDAVKSIELVVEAIADAIASSKIQEVSGTHEPGPSATVSAKVKAVRSKSKTDKSKTKKADPPTLAASEGQGKNES